MAASDRKKTGHREITTHVSIHTIHLDGLRELHRHFLRLPDGAVVEVSSRFIDSNLFRWVGRASRYRFLPSYVQVTKCLPDVNQNQNPQQTTVMRCLD